MKLELANIGGVVSGEIDIDQGVNVVQGTNFAGKSSIMRGIETVMGTSDLDNKEHPLMETAEQGNAKIHRGENTVQISLKDEGGSVTSAGRPYIRNERTRMLAHLFCFLGEQNPIRQAVEMRDNDRLTKLLQRPLDMEDIDEEIRKKQDERDSVQDEIEVAEKKAKQQADLQETVTRLEDELEELRERKAELEQQLDESDDVDEELRAELSDKRSEESRLETTLKRQENELESLEEKLDEKRSELADVEIPEEPDTETDLHAKRDQLDDLNDQIELLEDLYYTNKRVLEEGFVDVVADIDRTIDGDNVESWVCGEVVPRQQIEDRIEQIDETRKKLSQQKVSVQQEINNIQKQKRKYQSSVDRKERLEIQIEQIEGNITEKEAEIETTRERYEQVSEDVEALEAERVESDNDELEDELASVERTIGQKEQNLESEREHLQEAMDADDELTTLRKKLSGIRGRLEQLRERKTEAQTDLADRFNEILGDIIEQFGTGFDGGRLKVVRNNDRSLKRYELVVARDDREADLANLSEGETTLVGFAVALAGWQVFVRRDGNEKDRVKVMYLDSVGELSSENLHTLLEYIANECDPEYLISSAYPEAGDFDANVIKPDLWTAVSDNGSPTAAD
jgi:DNA repair exonuclease SbcCD ATPase subunit